MGCNTEIIHYSKFYFWNAILIPILAISAIGFNLYFIEIMDNGLTAIAYATLVTFVIHNCIRCGIIYYYYKILPFNIGHLKLLGILAICSGVLFLVPTINNVFLSIGIKSFLIVALVSVGIIWTKVSLEISGIFLQVKSRLFNR